MSKYRLGLVAVVPFWSQSDNLNADSNYAYLRIVLPEMVKHTEDTIFLMFFPDPNFGSDKWTYTPDGLQSDRIRFYPWSYDTAMSSSVVSFDMMKYKKLEDDHGPTMYWLNQVESGPFISGGYVNSYNNTSRPVLIAQHHYIIHRSLPYVYESQFPRQWLQIGGSLASDRVIYNSLHCHQMAREAFSEYLTPDRMAHLERKSQTIQFGLLRGDEPLAPEATAEDKPVFLYNHRFEFYKRPDLTFAAFRALREAGHKFEVWASQTVGQMTGGRKEYYYDRSIFAPSRSQYLLNAAVPAINTINSRHETFCIALLDSLALGHIVVAPNSVTFPELVPPGYPYLFENETEQVQMLDHILKTWPCEYNKWRIPLSDHARQRFNLTRYVTKYLEVMNTEEQLHRQADRKETTLTALHTVYSGMKKGIPYPPNELRRILARTFNSGKQAFPTRRLVREALALREDIHLSWQNGLKLTRE